MRMVVEVCSQLYHKAVEWPRVAVQETQRFVPQSFVSQVEVQGFEPQSVETQVVEMIRVEVKVD